MEAIEAILTRTSVREYRMETIPGDLLQELLAAAMQAPSAGNQQIWHFILVTERKQLDALAEALPFGKMLASAPLGVVVCAELELEKYPGFWVQDCSAATQNLLLAAHARGLGAVWVGVYPEKDRVASLRQILDLPGSVIPLSVVPLGYPASTHEPAKTRYNETRLHLNHW